MKIRQKNGITGKDKCQDMGIGGGGMTRMKKMKKMKKIKVILC